MQCSSIKLTVLILTFLISLSGCGHYNDLRKDSSAQYHSQPLASTDSSGEIGASEEREVDRRSTNGAQQDAAELTPIK